MNILKIIQSRQPISAFKLTENVKFHTTALAHSKLDPIAMSFTSYESSQPTDGSPPLIVMHGLFGSKANWNSLCKAFHQKTIPKRKILAVDARNHGNSPHSPDHSYEHMAEDVRTFLQQHNINKAALLGHSMGGRALMYFALKHPELVDKLIVADISPISTSPNLSNMLGLFNLLQNINLPSNVPMSSARADVDKQLQETIDDKDFRSFLVTNLTQKPDGSYAWRVNIPVLTKHFHKYIARFPDVGSLKYTGPVLFIAGGLSNFMQKTDHPDILKLFPKAEFKEIDDAGHWVHSEKPTEFLELCIEFLNRKTTNS